MDPYESPSQPRAIHQQETKNTLKSSAMTSATVIRIQRHHAFARFSVICALGLLVPDVEYSYEIGLKIFTPNNSFVSSQMNLRRIKVRSILTRSSPNFLFTFSLSNCRVDCRTNPASEFFSLKELFFCIPTPDERLPLNLAMEIQNFQVS